MIKVITVEERHYDRIISKLNYVTSLMVALALVSVQDK